MMGCMGSSKPGSFWLGDSYQGNMPAAKNWPYQASPVAFSNVLKALQTAFLALKASEATVGAWQSYERLSAANLHAAKTLPSKLGHGLPPPTRREATFEAAGRRFEVAPPDFETLVQGIEIADVLVKTVKIASFVLQWLQSPAGSLVGLGSENGVVLGYKTAKMAVKGVKVSKGLLRIVNVRRQTQANPFDAILKNLGFVRWFKVRYTDFCRIISGFKASFKALKAVDLSTSLAKEVFIDRQASLVNWGLLVKSYKASKVMLATIDALGTFKGGILSAVSKGLISIKGTVQGVTVMAKAAVVSKEIYILLIKGLGILRGALQAFRVISEQRGGAKEIVMNPDCGSKLFFLVDMRKRGRTFPKCTLRLTSRIVECLIARHAITMKLEKQVFPMFSYSQSAHLSALLSGFKMSSDFQIFCEAYLSNYPNILKSSPSFFLCSPLLSLSSPIVEM
ncbi:hypothetical protein O6H91_11G105700 [Diphasiastrum complanatum]|uniref:Uncharacterized protein n=1 Tax=Diphasiastrum complanatum TaxID=34168 RepID=A0ACC2CCD3_DIPCM|nr:hypothetical protein O6H91_11G105700 [Diphasiastrum complanatum]